MQVDIVRGSTQQTIAVAVEKSDGTAYASLPAASVSVRYKRAGDSAWSTPTALSDMTLPAFVQNGWQAWGGGLYEFGLPNAALAAGSANWVDLELSGPADMVPVRIRIALTGTDYHGTMLLALWRRFYKKATCSATELKTYADDGTTVLTTQALSDSGGVQTQGAAV